MKFTHVLTSVCAAAVTITALAQVASAANLTKTEYDNQLGTKYGLSYDQWTTFNQLATNEERLAIENSDLNPISLDDVTWETGSVGRRYRPTFGYLGYVGRSFCFLVGCGVKL